MKFYKSGLTGPKLSKRQNLCVKPHGTRAKKNKIWRMIDPSAFCINLHKIHVSVGSLAHLCRTLSRLRTCWGEVGGVGAGEGLIKNDS